MGGGFFTTNESAAYYLEVVHSKGDYYISLIIYAVPLPIFIFDDCLIFLIAPYLYFTGTMARFKSNILAQAFIFECACLVRVKAKHILLA